MKLPFSKSKPLFSEERQVFPTTYLDWLQQELQASRYLAQNVLNYRFDTTLGFSLIFQARTEAAVLQKFAYLEPFVHRIAALPHNLYYLNILVLGLDSRVERHIDHSIRGYGQHLPFPRRVSVLYVAVPEMNGGELRLYDNSDQIAAIIAPERNKLVHFRGDLKHDIAPISALEPAGGLYRISLVCEQYRLARKDLKKFPEFILKSAIPFAQFVAEEAGEQ